MRAREVRAGHCVRSGELLMQTLANEVEEAARAGLVALGAVAHGEGWMRVEVTPTHESYDMVEAWVELVQDGLDALAESYPENVELVVNMVFADGKHRTRHSCRTWWTER